MVHAPSRMEGLVKILDAIKGLFKRTSRQGDTAIPLKWSSVPLRQPQPTTDMETLLACLRSGGVCKLPIHFVLRIPSVELKSMSVTHINLIKCLQHFGYTVNQYYSPYDLDTLYICTRPSPDHPAPSMDP